MQNDAKTEPGSTQGYEIGRQNKYGKEELKQYYLNMVCQLCPGALSEPSEEVKLSMLYNKIKRIIKVLSLLDSQQLTTYCNKVHLSSGYYLMLHTIPYKNRESMNMLLAQIRL